MHRTLHHRFARLIVIALLLATVPAGNAAEQSAPEVLFRNVRVFDGRSTALSNPTSVLVRGNRIAAIGAGAVPANPALTIIDGGGRTLMPGLIDAHVHIMFATIPQLAVLTSDIGFVNVAAAKAANDMLLRGFTSIRDLGGPVFGLKQGIDAGLVAGPRIWPSGAFISQSGGHGDFRLPNDMPARPGDFTYSERVGAAAIADDPDTVRKRAREQLALGASQIKLMSQEAELTKYWEINHRKANSAFALTYHDGVSSWMEHLNLNKDGLLTIGEVPVGGVLLDVRGNAQFRSVGSGAYYAPLNITADGILTTATSDMRLKTNIAAIGNALETVQNLRGIRFNWLNDDSGNEKIGFVAQEVEKVLPEVVFTNPVDGYKGVNYAEITAVLVEAVKEQQEQIAVYKSENDILRSQLQSLQEKVDRIEALLAK